MFFLRILSVVAAESKPGIASLQKVSLCAARTAQLARVYVQLRPLGFAVLTYAKVGFGLHLANVR